MADFGHIKTRFSIGDTFWMLYNNKAHEAEIKEVVVTIKEYLPISDLETSFVTIKYGYKFGSSTASIETTLKLEKTIPVTKEELLASL